MDVNEHLLKDLLKREERELFISRVRIATYYMGVPLVLLFSVVDLSFKPDLLSAFFKVRLLSIPVALICYNLYRLPIIQDKYFTIPAHLFTLYLGSYNAYMVAFSDFEKSVYYAGLNLVGFGSLSFLPWSATQMVVSALTIYGPYLLTIIIGHKNSLDFSFLIPHLAFCSSTIFLGVITLLNTRSLRRKEMDSRTKLMDEISSKDKVIEQKTKEGVYLEKLTSQFSPQIIDGVKSGRLSLDGLVRKEVTSIFLDIESSTNRSIRLDHGDYTKVLSEFFSSAIAVFLKHDVTVATYLGDGLLAFTNAPQEQAMHRLKAVQACLSLLALHHSRQDYYLEKWRTHFNIRIGINTGFSFVGFFPSFRQGTYTAIGSPVSLASRLCSQAPPNSILVTKGLLKEIAEQLDDVNVSFIRSIDSIKGFEGETFDLFGIEPKYGASTELRTKCPLCQAELVEQNDLGDCRLLKCISCGYSDLVSKENQGSVKPRAA